ncbi:MAG: efflux RND transporter permease subunit [Hyphomicrobiales bacterium]|nr:efflux RND transporter permease subunit [Hyphomicrobiales bacterium]
MLTGLVKFSLRHRNAVFAAALFIMAYGTLALVRANYDVFPEFAPPMAVVVTEAPGLSAGEVERLVTNPVEADLGGTIGLASMRSKSLQGLSMVTLIFGNRLNVWRARQVVNEKLAQLTASLPQGIGVPHLLPLASATSIVMQVGLTSTSLSPMALDTIARFTLRPQLLSVPGVADAIVFGGAARQIRIEASARRLQLHDLALSDVITAVRAAFGTPDLGFVSTPNQRLALSLHSGESSPAAIAGLTIGWHQGAGVRLGDVAKVRYASAPQLGAASIDGQNGIVMVIENQFGSNTLQVSQALDRRLAALAPVLAQRGVILHAHLFHPADFIVIAVHHLGLALLVGAVLVALVLLAFLDNARTALISVTAVPLSLLTAIIVLGHFGVTLNTMSIGGLAIALGEVVDDAIIDVENIHRRLAENRALASPRPARSVVLRAAVEVRSAVVFATLVVVTVFLPVLALRGVAGRLFAPLAEAYIAAVLASLLVALTLTPALALTLLDRPQGGGQDRRWIAGLKNLHTRVLQNVINRVRLAGILVVLGAIAIVASLPFARLSTIPALREGHYIIHMGLAPGSSLGQSMRVGAAVSKAVLRIPGVASIAQTAGRAQDVIDPVGVHLSEFGVTLKPMGAAGQARVLAAIRARLQGFPGLSTAVNTFLTERIDETITGTTAPVVIKVFGPDLDVIERVAVRIAELVGKIHGVRSVNVEQPASLPLVSVRLRPRAIAAAGFQPGTVTDALAAANAGVTLGEVHRHAEIIPVTVALQPAPGDPLAALREITLRNSDGLAVPLRDLAHISETSGRYQITHEGGQRIAAVSVHLGSGGVGAFTSTAQRLIRRGLKMPPGTFALFTGEGATARRAALDLAAYGAMALAGVIVLLALALKNARAVALVMLNLPFAFIGGIVVLLPGGLNLSLGALVGFLTLFGISLRNSIMLIAHCQRSPGNRPERLGAQRAIAATRARLVPILMTAAATALALAPLALSSGAPGNEIEGPMALVILGGLVTSTLLNLLVLPIFAARWLIIGKN